MTACGNTCIFADKVAAICFKYNIIGIMVSCFKLCNLLVCCKRRHFTRIRIPIPSCTCPDTAFCFLFYFHPILIGNRTFSLCHRRCCLRCIASFIVRFGVGDTNFVNVVDSCRKRSYRHNGQRHAEYEQDTQQLPAVSFLILHNDSSIF